MQLTLADKKIDKGGATSFYFESGKPTAWKAGQFIRYTLRHDSEDDRDGQRFFTIASAPHEGKIRITTRITPEKGSSFKAALDILPMGTKIEAEGPRGGFVIEDPAQEYVFIAGGIGITPFRSILLDLNHRSQPINVTLLYSNRVSEAVFREELDALAVKNPTLKIHYIIEPERIDAETLRKYIPDLSQPFFYISGPEPMVRAMEQLLDELEVTPDCIRRDYFPGYNEI